MSKIYFDGEGINLDKALGQRYLIKAAKNGLPEAQFEFAKLLEEKDRSDGRIAPLIISAAESGFEDAFKQAGLYLRNSTQNSDKEKGAFFLKRAADAGDGLSQLETAYNFDNGVGFPKDREEAIKYYKVSAKQGIVEAEIKLADAYNYGDGVNTNFELAFKYYKRAA